MLLCFIRTKVRSINWRDCRKNIWRCMRAIVALSSRFEGNRRIRGMVVGIFRKNREIWRNREVDTELQRLQEINNQNKVEKEAHKGPNVQFLQLYYIKTTSSRLTTIIYYKFQLHLHPHYAHFPPLLQII